MAAALLLSSCYSSTVTVGNLKPTDPTVEVATTHDAHFIGGLVGHKKREAKDYVGENKNYRVKQYQSFVDGLLAGITGYIYTPTTTKFYLPYGSDVPPRKKGEPVVFGVRAGLNMATLKHDLDNFDSQRYSEDISPRLGFNVGVILDIPLSKSLYLQPGLYYSQKGAKYEREYLRSSGGEKITTKCNFFELPILASYRFDITDDLQLQINAGPFAAYGQGMDLEREDGDTRSYDSDFDAGVHAGVGILFTKHIYAGIGYEHGFLSQGDEAFTRNLLVNIGYNF